MLESKPRPTIARIWRGRTRREVADEYEAYNYEAGVRPLIEKALGVQTFREDGENESEFVTISWWESVEAMSRFTGGDPTKVHHLPRDAEFLIELPRSVQVLRLRSSHGQDWMGLELPFLADKHRPARHRKGSALGALAIGALATGALALGAMAIGQLAIGQLAIGRTRIRRLDLDELRVGKIRALGRRRTG